MSHKVSHFLLWQLNLSLIQEETSTIVFTLPFPVGCYRGGSANRSHDFVRSSIQATASGLACREEDSLLELLTRYSELRMDL